MYYLIQVHYAQRRTDEDGTYYQVVDDVEREALSDNGVDFNTISESEDRAELEMYMTDSEQADAAYHYYY